ncbi:MAG: class I SAM-dependent methyltransferase [Clostridia bacterium]|nr:class I SAM-dependent methyltransferase [Clostridia bacterium]
MNLGLGKRLTAVVNEIDGNSLADVGCDHGKVSIAALLEGKVERVIACDISSKSLQKAIDLAEKCRVKNIEFRAGDGLQVIEDGEVSCVVIAGMGGNEIMSILSHIPQGVKRLVLSPHRNTVELRRFLSEKDIYIDKDYIVKDGRKFYDIMVAQVNSGKDCALDRRQLLLGKNQIGGDFDEYLRLLRQKYDALMQMSADSEQAKLYKEMLDMAEEMRYA